MNNAMRLFLVCVLALWTIAYFTSAIRKAGFLGRTFLLVDFPVDVHVPKAPIIADDVVCFLSNPGQPGLSPD